MAAVWISVPSLGTNSSLPAHCCSISKRPSSLIAPNCILVRKSLNFCTQKPNFCTLPLVSANRLKRNWNFDGGKARNGVINALTDSDAESPSANMEIVAKELNFSPTFQDYLKVMESIRTDRSENPNVNVDAVSPKKTLVGKGDSRKKREFSSGGGRRGGRWGLVERILEKRTLGEGGGDSKDANNMPRNRVEDGGVDKLKIHGQSKHALKSKIVYRSSDTEGVGKSPEKVYVKKVNHIDNHQLMDGNGVKRNEERQLYESNAEEPDFVNINKLKNRAEAGRVGRLRIHGQSKDALKSKNVYRSGDAEGVRSSSELVYIKKVNHADNQQLMNEKEMRRNEGRQLYESKVEVPDSVKVNNLASRKTLIGSNTESKLDEVMVTETSYKSSSLSRANLSKNSDEYEVNEDGRKDRMFLRMKQRKAEGSLSGSGCDRDILKQDVGRQSTSGRYDRLQHKADRLGPRATETHERSAKNNRQLDTVDRGEIDVEDRAAFRTFEVFTDVRNRPRVLRMELEERLQKLAKQ